MKPGLFLSEEQLVVARMLGAKRDPSKAARAWHMGD